MIAFLFPGQGSQAVGMGRALAERHPECRQVFEEADEALKASLSDVIFHGPAETLTLTEFAQPAILTMSVALARLLASRGFEPSMVAGHSLGEYSAHVVAGTIGFADAVRTVRQRGRYMQEAVPVGVGSMAAILGLDGDTVGRACAEVAEGEVVSAANLNAPGQVVIAGAAAAVDRAITRAKALGAKRAVRLQVSAPFHCALMKPAEERLARDLRALAVSDPRVPVVANVDAEPKLDGEAAVEALIRQVSAPVRWEDVVRRLVADGVTAFVEVGPGSVLSGLVRKIAPGAGCTATDQPEPLEAVASAFAVHSGVEAT
ncbi:MAG: ACP S-malonyltransferase [Acidobacteriota bacterium]